MHIAQDEVPAQEEVVIAQVVLAQSAPRTQRRSRKNVVNKKKKSARVEIPAIHPPLLPVVDDPPLLPVHPPHVIDESLQQAAVLRSRGTRFHYAGGCGAVGVQDYVYDSPLELNSR